MFVLPCHSQNLRDADADNDGIDADDGQLEALVLDYEASRPLKGVTRDLAANQGGQPFRIDGTVERLPSSALVTFQRDAEPVPVADACGLTFAQRIPGHLESASSKDPLMGVDLSLGAQGSSRLTPSGGNYLGIDTRGAQPHVRLQLDHLSHVNLSTHAPTAQATHPLQRWPSGRGDLDVEYVTTSRQDDQVFRMSGTGAKWPISFACHNERVKVWTGDLEKTDDRRLFDTVTVQAETLTIANRTVAAVKARADELVGGFTVDMGVLDRENTRLLGTAGFAVHGGRARNLWLDATLAPPSEDEVQACNRNGPERSSNSMIIDWDMEVAGKANATLTTHQGPLTGLPDTANWVRTVNTCEEETYAVQFEGLEDLKYGSALAPGESCERVHQVWSNVSVRAPMVLKSEFLDCESSERMTIRVGVEDVPNTFSITSPVPTWHRLPKVKEGAVFTSSQDIRRFTFARDGCLLVAEEYDPKPGGQQVIGIDEALEAGGRAEMWGHCMDQRGR